MSTFRELLKRYSERSRTAEKSRLTQEEISLRLGQSSSTYVQWERRRGQPSEREVVVKLIEIFYEGQGIKHLTEANVLLASRTLWRSSGGRNPADFVRLVAAERPG